MPANAPCRIFFELTGPAGNKGSRENKALVHRGLSTLIKDHDFVSLLGAAMLELSDESPCDPAMGT